MYNRAAIKDANPERWDEIRKQKLYMAKRDYNNRIIIYPQGLV